jgi:Type I restriction modification DNA specificity domain
VAIDRSNEIESLKQIKMLRDFVDDIFLGLSLARQPAGDVKRVATPMVNAKDLADGFLAPAAELQKTEVPESSQIERFRLRVGDVVMSSRGLIKVAGVGPEQAGAIAGANLIVVRPGNVLSPPLVLAFLRHPSTLAALARLSVGTTVPSINVSAIGALEIVVPPSEKQAQLSKLIELSDEHYAAARRAADLRHKLAQEVAIRELTL